MESKLLTEIEKYILHGESYCKIDKLSGYMIETGVTSNRMRGLNRIVRVGSILIKKYGMETDEIRLFRLIDVTYQLDLFLMNVDVLSTIELTFSNRYRELFPEI